MAKKRFHSAEGARRSSEMRDSGMLHDNKSAVANMPQDVKYHAWPSAHVGLDSRIDDTISGINDQMRSDESKARSILNPKKY